MRTICKIGTVLIFLVVSGRLSAQTYWNVVKYGARPDGRAPCTQAIQRTIDACSKAGGGTVYFPAGRYLTGPLFLRSHLIIRIGAGAVVLFRSEIRGTPSINGSWEGLDRKVYASLFTGFDLEDITITGRGVLDGQGKVWWDAAIQTMEMRRKFHLTEREPENPPGSLLQWGRPKMIDLYRCRNVEVSGVTITNSPSWTIHPIYCRDVAIHDVRIIQPYDSPNTDGIDPESCSDVRITGCYIDCGDDCVAIKSGYNASGRAKGIPCQNVVISNCTFAHGRSAVGIGSEMSGGVRNVSVTGCIFHGTLRGLRVKTGRGRGGVVEGLIADDIIMDSVSEGISIDMYYDGHDTATRPVTVETPFFRNIRYFNIIGHHLKQAIEIHGLPEAPVDGITLENIFIDAAEGADCEYVHGLVMDNVNLNTKGQRQAIRLRHCPGAAMRNMPEESKGEGLSAAPVDRGDGTMSGASAGRLDEGLSAAPAVAGAASAAGSEVTPACRLPGAIRSPDFRVMVNRQELFVEKIAKFDVPLHFTQFAFSGSAPVQIEISCDEKISRYSIHTAGPPIPANSRGNTLVIRLERPQYFAVRVNDLEYLFVAAEHAESGAAHSNAIDVTTLGINSSGIGLQTARLQAVMDSLSEEGRPSTLYFPAGLYRTGQVNLRSHVSLYLEDGALIKGSTAPGDYNESLIRMDHVSDVSITGRGTIDGAGWDGLRKNGGKGLYLLFLSDCQRVRIEGVQLRDPCFWNTRVFRCKDVRMRDIKILNDRPERNWVNTDGIDFDSSTGGDVFNVLMQTGDDNLVVKGLEERAGYDPAHIRFRRIVGLSNSAAAKIGTETRTPLIHDIEFSDIDIVQCKRAIVISGFDSAVIRNIVFKNIRVDNLVFQGKEEPRIIDFEITDHSWRDCVGRCRISGVLVDGVTLPFSLDGVSSQILGRSREYGVTDVRIRHFDVMGKRITSAKDAHLIENEYASGIRFE
ncbi:MAG TPA: glycosyl hydrolase family 28 protein [Puia sp.]|nr:glycosyl hydrolase family 28 protein [Puia sp.]